MTPAQTLEIVIPFTRCGICRDQLGDQWEIITAYQKTLPACRDCAKRSKT